MDSSTAKMKQKPINAFFAASAKKEDPKSTQKKISAFFGGSAKAAATPNAAANGASTPCGPTAKLPAADATPVNQPAVDVGGQPATEPPSAKEAAAAAAPATAKAPAAPKPANVPAGGSTSKPKAQKESATKKPAKAGAKGAAKPAGGASRRRLRKVVIDDEEGGDDVDAGLEDDLGDSKDDKLEDSDYEGASGSGSESDEDFSAEEEEDDDDEEGGNESECDCNVGVGSKRKRPPTKASGPAKRPPASAKPPASGAAATPAGARTPAAAAGGRLALDGAATPHHGTVSKGPASATARTAGRSSLATPATVAPGPSSAARSRGGTSVAGGAGAVTPSSVRSGKTSMAETPSKSQGTSEVTLGVAATMEGDAARFADRMAQRFPFLHPDNIMDADRRRPDHPDYDPRTLFIPPSWFKEYKISEGQQQWWNFKSRNFDSVLLFKMGKFYEMFEMDAYVGVDVLGLAFMKGDQPHAGFPEVKYADMAESLARAGYRVVVVEQTETPEMLARRNEQRKQQGLKLCNVVDRQKVAVLSRGTLVDAEMVASRPDASYVLAVTEVEEPGEAEGEGEGEGGKVRIGLCAVDAASGQVLLGEFVDDEVRSSLRTQLTALQPQELVLPRKALSSTTAHVLRNGLRDPRVNTMRGAAGDWTPDKTYRQLRDNDYFNASAAAQQATEGEEADAMEVDGGAPGPRAPSAPPELDASKRWPALLRRILADGVASRPAAMAALGGIIAFLKDSLLDRAVLPLGRFEELPALAPGAGGSPQGADGEGSGPLYLALNGAALENLEILENGDGGSAGTLLAVLDHCTTPFGRRRLRQWLCRPLGRIPDIVARQDAVADLCGPMAEAAGQARKMLAGVSDLERAITRLHASTVSGASGRDAANVVLYEDAGKRRVAALTAALKDLRAAHGALGRLREALPASGVGAGAGAGGASALLRRIVVERCRPDEVSAALAVLEGATDWKEAAQTGRAVPEPGVDEQYDRAVEELEGVQGKLQDYLKEVRQRFGREVAFVSVNKDSHLLEVPEGAAGRLGKEFNLVGNRKGYKRYTTSRLKSLVAEHDQAMEAKEGALSSILARLVVKFVQHRSLWLAVVEAVADLDALMSLAAHAMAPADGGPMCRPNLVPPAPSPAPSPSSSAPSPTPPSAVFQAVALRHPAGVGGRNNGAFVPNDVQLGGTDPDPDSSSSESRPHPPFVLLSGPNMGGKSTLLRQVCLATILAQVGACVPAQSLTLSPADALFVRMGARDSIMTGQSTFFIELAETAAMLAKATSNSLVALDELGRGTATLDGAAVAGAVLQHMSTTTGCRGLFATHYHHLSDEHADDPRVAVMHMACAVEGADDEDSAAVADRNQDQGGAEGSREVTFLYRLTKGACPKSYGTNVARLAGLPPRVVERAAEVSAQWDQQQQQQQQQQGQEQEGQEQPEGQQGDVDSAMDVDGGSAAAPAPAPGAVSLPLLAGGPGPCELRSLLAEVRDCVAAAAVRGQPQDQDQAAGDHQHQQQQQAADVARLRRLQEAARQLVAAN